MQQPKRFIELRIDKYTRPTVNVLDSGIIFTILVWIFL